MGVAVNGLAAARGIRPGHRVGTGQPVTDGEQPAGLEPKPVQPQRSEVTDDEAGEGGVLAAADGADTDTWQALEMDASSVVHVHVPQVVVPVPALQYGDERQVWGEGAQFQVVVHGQDLVARDAVAGAL